MDSQRRSARSPRLKVAQRFIVGIEYELKTRDDPTDESMRSNESCGRRAQRHRYDSRLIRFSTSIFQDRVASEKRQ